MHLVLIGAGPHGLAVLVALADRGAWPEQVTVLDPHAGWCTAWDDKLARLDLDRLRSPQVHHPGVRPMELRDLVEALPPTEQLAWRRPEAERIPTPAGMRALIDRLASSLGPHARLLGRATGMRVAATGSGVTVQAELSGAPARTLEADAVVLAHNPSRPRLGGWTAALVAEGRAVHASTIDIRTAAVTGRDVLIVGGGLTAACLALAAARRGGRVTMVSRRPLRARPYDVDASWLGPRRLADYDAATPAGRRSLIDRARDGGTIPPRTLDELRRQADAGTIALHEGVDAERDVRAALDGEAPPAVWLATGFVQDVADDPLVAPLVAALGVPIHDGLPEVDDHLRLDGAPVYVTGPYAALGVGPACRNLAGARPAAQRIASGLAPIQPQPPGDGAMPEARAKV